MRIDGGQQFTSGPMAIACVASLKAMPVAEDELGSLSCVPLRSGGKRAYEQEVQRLRLRLDQLGPDQFKAWHGRTCHCCEGHLHACH